MLTERSMQIFQDEHAGEKLEIRQLSGVPRAELLDRLTQLGQRESTADLMHIFEGLEEHGDLVPFSQFNLGDSANSIADAFEQLGVEPARAVRVVWMKSGHVDEMSYADLQKIFDYAWVPGADDVCLCDLDMNWIVTLNHSGGVGVLHNDSDTEQSVDRVVNELKVADIGVPTGETHQIGDMHVTNYSSVPINQLMSWLPHDLDAREVVFFPDVCPGKSPLPTGTAIRTSSPEWRKLAISDCGCGMQLLRSELKFHEFSNEKWSELGRALQKNSGKLGDLGGGNHFIDAIVSYEDEQVYFLVHTGSRNESGHVDALVNDPERFDQEFDRVVLWARANRDAIASEIKAIFGDCDLVLDLPHNTYEKQKDGSVIIRKGAVKVEPGQLTILPSCMNGDVSLLEASPRVEAALGSLSHGTGRTMSRADAKRVVGENQIAQLRQAVFIPEYISDTRLRTEAPACYRPLDECIDLLGGLARERQRFAVIAYLGGL